MKLQYLATTAAALAIAATGALSQQTIPDGNGIATPEVAEPLFTSIEEMTVGDVLGKVVYDPEGKSIGEIDYVIQTADGVAAVIGIGGFIGLGEYTVAIPLEEFKLREDGYAFLLNTDKKTLKAQPEIDESGLDSLPRDVLVAELLPAEGNTERVARSETETEAETDMVEAEMVTGSESETDMAAREAVRETEAESEMAEAELVTGTETETEMTEAEAVTETQAETEMVETELVTESETDVEMAEADVEAEAEAELAETDDGLFSDATDAVAEGRVPDVTNPELANDAMVARSTFDSIDQMTVGDVLGTIVYDPQGDTIGEIDYVVTPPKGVHLVIGIGGFLGLGEYTVSIPVEEFRIREDGRSFELAATKEELKALPEFDESNVVGASADQQMAGLSGVELDPEPATEATEKRTAEVPTE